MKEKIRKILYEYSIDSRITTLEIGKRIRASQQSVSYLLNTLKEKNLIEGETVIVDPVKLGYINILVGFNFIKMGHTLKKKIIEELKEIDMVIGIEEAKEGVDLIIEYSAPNLSAFHKIYSETVYRFYERLKTVFIFPIIVKHKYDKKYLSKKPVYKDMILSGDRIQLNISDKEISVLKELIENPKISIIDISEKLEMPVKSVIKTKQNLEKKNIIRGYSCIFNYNELGIKRKIIFFRFLSEGIREINKFVDFTKKYKYITEFVKVIGASQVGIVVESLDEINIVSEIRENFPIESYMIIKSEKIHKKKYLPDIDNNQ